MLSIKNLAFKHDNSLFELSVEDWEVQAGSRCMITGSSGSGKTTLLQLIAGNLMPSTGEIKVSGNTITDLNDKQRRSFRLQTLGLIFQDFRLFPYLTTAENILLPFKLSKLDASTEPWCAELAESLGISQLLSQQAGVLSRGEQQRVAICRALATKPRCILADEPTASVDSVCRDAILDILCEYCESHEATLILTSHDLSIRNRFNEVVDIQELRPAEVSNR